MSVARRRQMIERDHARLSVAAQCRLVSISRSSFYYAPVPVPVPETAETLALMAVIDASFLDHPWYGNRQMARHLCRLGHAVGQRPHSPLGGRTPDEVYGQIAATPHPGHAPDVAFTRMAA